MVFKGFECIREMNPHTKLIPFTLTQQVILFQSLYKQCQKNNKGAWSKNGFFFHFNVSNASVRHLSLATTILESLIFVEL